MNTSTPYPPHPQPHHQSSAGFPSSDSRASIAMSASTSARSADESGYSYGGFSDDRGLVQNAGMAGGYGQGTISPQEPVGSGLPPMPRGQSLGMPVGVPVQAGRSRQQVPDDRDDWPSDSDEDEPSFSSKSKSQQRSKSNGTSSRSHPKPEFLPLPSPSHQPQRTYTSSPRPQPGASQADLLSPGLSEHSNGDYLKAKVGDLERNPSSATGSGIGFVGELNGQRRDGERPGLDRRGSSAQREIGRKGIRKLLPKSVYTRMFLFLVFIETIVDIAIQVYLYLKFDRAIGRDDQNSTLIQNKKRFPVYLALFGVAHLWQLVLAIDAAIFRNTIQIIGLAMFNALFLAWTALQISEIKSMFASSSNDLAMTDDGVAASVLDHVNVTVMTGVMLGVIAFVEVGMILLSWAIYKEMARQTFHELGASTDIKRFHMHYQILVTIIRFAAFFFVGFGVQFIWLVLREIKDAEYYATIALLPGSLLVLLWGLYAAKRESLPLMVGFMAALVGAIGYFVYKIVRIYQAKDLYQQVFKSLTIFAGASILITVMAFIWSFIVLMHFDKGLKHQRERAATKKKEKRAERKRAMAVGPDTPGADAEIEMKRHRMSLD